MEGAIGAGEASAVNLDDFADEDIVFPARPDPPIALSDLRYVLDHPKLLPKGSEASPLDGKDYRFLDRGLPRAVRITVDRDFYEMHSDSVEFWTPGNPTFPDLNAYRT